MADSILSGLGSFGLSDLEGMSLFEDEKEKNEKKVVVLKATPVLSEEDFLLDKSMECPLCHTKFKARVPKGGKARLLSTDMDLRPKYQELDVTKYDVIMCPCCGYTALQRFFPTLLKIQADRIKEKISMNFKTQTEFPATYTYDMALERYKMALVNSIVKGGKASEKGYICLKASWIARGKCEEIGEAHADYAKYKAMETEFTKNAYDAFSQAITQESFPMCGMDESTVDYLLAALALKTEHYDVCQKLVSKILVSRVASSRIKDKASEIKEELVKQIKKAK